MLYKSCRDLQQKSIVPTHLPYVVSLVRFYETESAIYLQLQHAAGGRLWSYVGAYLNQCSDAAANIEPHRPADNPVKKDRPKIDRIGSDANRSRFPASADSVTVSASATCPELGERDLKLKLSSDIDSVDESHKLVDRKVSSASSPECLSQGFGELLQSSVSPMKYFRIDSNDSSERTSRQVSCNSNEDSFCRLHSVALSLGICRFCSDSETTRLATCSDSETNSPDETSIYDMCHDKPVDKSKQMQEAGGNTFFPGYSLTDEGTGHGQRVEVDQSRHSALRPNSQERSFDSCDKRRRRRTMSSAFGELDLAENTRASSTAPPRPLVHLPESCVRQWAAEMVVAVSRLHSIGLICRQVDLSC